MQNKLKFGIIGVGNMGTAHAKHLYEGKIEGGVTLQTSTPLIDDKWTRR